MNLGKMGKIISEKRRDKSLTQNQLGEKLGVSGKAVSKWERGRSAPDISILNELSKILEVNISEILTGEKNKSVINEEDLNNISLKIYKFCNQVFERKFIKYFVICSFLIISILTILCTMYFFTNYNKCLVYKISSLNKSFSMEGVIAKNQKENTIIITGITYNDLNAYTEEELKIKRIEVVLENKNTNIISREYDFQDTRLSEALKEVFIIVNESPELNENSTNQNKLEDLKLIIKYIDNFEKTGEFSIPIKAEKRFSNNKLFY